VLESARGKTDGAVVAANAIQGGGHVIGRFTKRHCAVVAGRALCDRLDVINETDVAPRRREVAAFTKERRLRMRLRFSLGAGSIVAGGTLPGRTLETTVGMARGAVDA